MRLRWRQFGRLLRWNSVLLPLIAACLAGLVTVVPILDGAGNRWCDNSGYVCSVSTNLLGVVFVAGLTSYWYYGVRRTLLLSRHRRAILTRLDRERSGDEPLAEDPARDAIMTTVLSRYGDWATQASGHRRHRPVRLRQDRLPRRDHPEAGQDPQLVRAAPGR